MRALRPNSDHHVATTEDPNRLPKPKQRQLARAITARVKGQKRKPDLVAADRGLLAKRALYATANTGYQDINYSWTVVWYRHRLREYVEIHGYASAGVCALLERAAEQYADGDFLRATIASSGAADIAEGLHQAARHAQLARSHELAAWELAAREGAVKKVHDGTGISGMSGRNGKLAMAIREDCRDIRSNDGKEWGGIDADKLEPIPDEPEPQRPASAPAKAKGRGGGRRVPATIGDPASTFRPPGGVEGRGTPFSDPSPKPNSPRPPLYTYCEGCSRNFKEKVCPRCGPQVPAGLSESAAGVIVATEDA